MTNKSEDLNNVPKMKQTGELSQFSDFTLSPSRKLGYDSAVDNISDRYKDNDHVLLVYFPQRSEPFLFADIDLVVIGRTGGAGVTLDTTPFQGRELGVSRVHAEISFNNGKYYVRDLRSTNGTWLNNEKLDPLVPKVVSAGDQLRIGHCLTVLYIQEDS